MAFGQMPGPPASRRQVEQLLDLVREAGHVDLRDARGPLGLNQRQAGGRFTRDEADELIARLEDEAATADEGPPTGQGGHDVEDGEAATGAVTPRPKRTSAAATRREAEQARRLAEVPAPALAAELQRRGWVVMEP